jgi:hypothetical protein
VGWGGKERERERERERESERERERERESERQRERDRDRERDPQLALVAAYLAHPWPHSHPPCSCDLFLHAYYVLKKKNGIFCVSTCTLYQ